MITTKILIRLGGFNHTVVELRDVRNELDLVKDQKNFDAESLIKSSDLSRSLIQRLL